MSINIVKRYCVSEGVCTVGSVIDVEPINENMIEITAKKTPRSNLLTRGVDAARLIAHNLAFDYRMVHAVADDFTCLYADGQDSPQEFWSIEVSLGEKATLVLLTTDQAEQIFTALPKKLYFQSFLFSPERYKRDAKAVRDANTDLKEAEKQRIEQAEWEALGPLGRVGKSPPQGWD